MRQERNHHEGAIEFIRRALPAMHGALHPPRKPVEQRSEGGDRDREANHKTPHAWRRFGQSAQQKEQQRRHWYETTAQIIENAVPVDGAERIRHQFAG